MTWPWLAIAFIGAFALSWLACLLVWRSVGVMDAPDNVRKLQEQPVPTSGGLGFAFATAVVSAIILFAAFSGLSAALGALLIAGAVGLALGFVDDRWPLNATLKLILLLGIGVAMTLVGIRAEMMEPWPEIAVGLPLALAVLGSLAWIIVVTNAVNFMDGANGLAMGMGAISSLGFAACFAILGEWPLAIAAMSLGGALAGFLMLNVRGRLFAGDAGALFVGLLLSGFGLLLVRTQPDLLFVPVLLLSPYLVDVLLTLVWRARRGRPLMSPHRDHAYQIALKANLSHGKVALFHAVWTFNAAAIAVMVTLIGGYVPTVAGIGMLLAGAWLHRAIRRFGERSGLLNPD